MSDSHPRPITVCNNMYGQAHHMATLCLADAALRPGGTAAAVPAAWGSPEPGHAGPGMRPPPVRRFATGSA